MERPDQEADEEAGALSDIAVLYRRSWSLVRAVPVILAIPFAAAMAQHAIEIGLGIYAHPHVLSAAERSARQDFGALKSLAVVATVLFVLRWWRFGGDLARVLRPDMALVRGIAITLLVEMGGSFALQLAGFLIGMASHVAGGSVAFLIVTAVPIILWAMVSVMLFPWYVALLTDDKELGLQSSVKAIYPIWGRCFGLYLAATLPPMVVHYALGFGAVGAPGPVVWSLMAVDALVVALMAVQFASAYYTIYLRARS